MSSSKKIYLQREFAAGVYLSEAQNPIPAPHTHCIRVYSIQGGRLNQGEGKTGNISQRWVENTNTTDSPVFKLSKMAKTIVPYPILH
jgi:hypothetical protein